MEPYRKALPAGAIDRMGPQVRDACLRIVGIQRSKFSNRHPMTEWDRALRCDFGMSGYPGGPFDSLLKPLTCQLESIRPLWTGMEHGPASERPEQWIVGAKAKCPQRRSSELTMHGFDRFDAIRYPSAFHDPRQGNQQVPPRG
jgi:hypothetical protein